MTHTVSAPQSAPLVPRPWAVFGFLALGVLATVAATVVSNGNIVVAVAPVLLAVLLAAVWVAPLRVPVQAVIFLSLALDAAGEGPWDSPVAPLGKLLAINLNKTLPVPGLMLPGVAFIMAFLVVIHLHRRFANLHIDNAVRSADVLAPALLASTLAVLWLCGYGIINGGEAQMAKIQVQSFLMTLLMGYLVSVAFTGQRDYRLLATLVVVAACIKAVNAMWVVHLIPPRPDSIDGKLNYATTHGDSLLFAAAAVLLIIRLAEMPSLRALVTCSLTMPLLFLGMAANNRRLVYVEMATALAIYWVISHRSPVKRLVVRAFIITLPLLLGYVAVGWNSGSRLFAPVKIFRSVGDSKVDGSTLYRDLENFNLLQTNRASPVLGTGLGHPFAEVIKLPDISAAFKEYQFMPHNSLLGLWAFCGPIGFTGVMLAPLVGLYLAASAYRAGRTPADRVAAYMALAMIVMFLIHSWGDIGFSERKAIYLVGPALGIAAQLAMANGAWRTRRARV